MSNFIYAFRTIRRNAKTYFYLSIADKVMALFKYYILVYVNKILFNRLSWILQTRDYCDQTMTEVFIIILISAGIPFLWGFINIKMTNIITISQLEYGKIMRLNINKKISLLDLCDRDDPQSQDRMRQSIKDSEAVPLMFREILNFISASISLIITIVIVSEVGWLFVIFVIVTTLPTYIINKRINQDTYETDKDNMRLSRIVDYTIGLYYNKTAIKEMKLFDYENFLSQKFSSSCDEINVRKVNLLKDNMKKRIAIFIFTNIINIINNVYICFKVIQKSFFIGEYSYYLSLTNNLSNSLTTVFSSISKINVYGVRINNFRSFMEKNSSIYNGKELLELPNDFSIVFDNVSFSYPNTDNIILKNISFQIKSGEKVSLVGLNGSGKSTLISLLLRFYDPTDGNIYINGKNIKDYDIDSYRKMFSCMFQDNIVYSYSLRENIIISDLNKEVNDEYINNLLNDWGILEGKDRDLNVSMNKNFNPDGEILSKGQAQSLQVARTIFRDSLIYIFDEPSASLDALTESRMVDKILKYSYGKTLILVSHRLSNLIKSDKIIVFKNGIIQEMGNHKELIETRGLYSEMFELQKNKYLT